jgi:hypothetical protein
MNYPGYQAPLQGMANQMAQYGRYGDSMLVHMNPAEVQGIAALSPTGKLTTNPVTGQPEAFLPFLAPILGTALGKAFLPALASKIGIAGLGGNLAGAIGSGLATTAVTGDLKEGILSGITGYGLGQMIGGAAKATDPAISATEEALKTAGKDVATTGAELAKSQASLEALSKAAGSPMSGVNPVADIASAGKAAADAQSAFQAATGAEAALQSRLAGLEVDRTVPRAGRVPEVSGKARGNHPDCGRGRHPWSDADARSAQGRRSAPLRGNRRREGSRPVQL